MTAVFGFAERLMGQDTLDLLGFERDTSYHEATHEARMIASAKTLSDYAAKLQAAGTLLLRSRQAERRAAATDTLESAFARAFALPESRTFPFADVNTVSQVAAPDSSWRLFTWQHFVNDSTYRYTGYFVPRDPASPATVLHDSAQVAGLETDFELRPGQWYGCVYYGVEPFALADGRPAWVLFGYDADGFYHRRKIADVLSFDRRGEPRFGAEVFVGSEADASLVRSRIILDYRADARVGLRFDPELGGIVHDRLVTGPAPRPGLAPSRVPDGSYDGFVLDRPAGLWRYREEYFDRVISAEPPRPSPILGTADERDIFGRPRKNK